MPNLLEMTTCTQLLDALQAGEQATWYEFDCRYRPIVFAFAMKLGLDRESAAEVAQETLVDFAADYGAGKYQRERGRLRSWIIGIARNRVSSYRRRLGRRREHRGESAFDQIAEPQISEAWDSVRRQVILDRAMGELRSATKTSPPSIRIFERVALDQAPAGQVALDHDKSVAEVHRIKYRLTKRLREIVERLETLYSEDP